MRQAFRIERHIVRIRTGEVLREEVVYGVTSLPPRRASAAALLAYSRAHWRIENRSHWVRDVTFDEDRSQVRVGSIPEVLAALRNTTISLLRLAGRPNLAAACRRHAAQPWEALALLGVSRHN